MLHYKIGIHHFIGLHFIAFRSYYCIFLQIEYKTLPLPEKRLQLIEGLDDG